MITIDNVIEPIKEVRCLEEDAENFYRTMLRNFNELDRSAFLNCTLYYLENAVSKARLQITDALGFYDEFLNKSLVEILRTAHNKEPRYAIGMNEITETTLMLIEACYKADHGARGNNKYLAQGVELLKTISRYIANISDKQKADEFIRSMNQLLKPRLVPARERLPIIIDEFRDISKRPEEITDSIYIKCTKQKAH